MPRALVSGITGQDGGYLTERLLATGWDVHGIVRESDHGVAELLARSPSTRLHIGDLTDHERIGRIVADTEPDEIYNLGGVSSVALSWQQPLMTAEVTGLGAAAVLEAAWQLQQNLGRSVRVLQASSAEIFGFPQDVPQTELTPLRPRTPYGAAKAFAHHLVEVYRGRGLHASTCILYNHESPRRPDTFVTRKITKAAAMISDGRLDRLSLGNLDVRRDWGWAPDYVDAMLLAVRHPDPADYVIATGQSHSVRDFVDAAFRRVGIEDWSSLVTIDEAFARVGDAPELVGDPAKARAELGWAPTVSFAELVARMVDRDLSDGVGAEPERA